MASLNVHAVGSGGQHEYMYSVRMGPGVITCMDMDVGGDRLLAGTALGVLAGVTLLRGKAKVEAEGCEAVDSLVIGVEEFSDEEEDEDEEEED